MTPSLPGRPVGRAVRNFSHEIGNGVSTAGCKNTRLGGDTIHDVGETL